jgi:hypothetical protein
MVDADSSTRVRNRGVLFIVNREKAGFIRRVVFKTQRVDILKGTTSIHSLAKYLQSV